MPHRPFVVLIVLAVASAAFGQQTSALINKQLDTLIKLDLKTSLPEAMKQITTDTGVTLDATPQVWDLLPYGRQTNITAKIENATLREALSAITGEIGLQFALRDESIEIQPTPPLARLGRRATLDELRTLKTLRGSSLEGAGIDARGVAFASLLTAVAERMEKSKIDIDNRAGDAAPPGALIGLSKNANLYDALEAMAMQTPATWYPWGNGIVLLKKQELVSNQLSKPVTLRYAGEDVTQVLQDLSLQAGVPFTYRPGSIQFIPPEFRRVRLVVDNAPIKQALESISAFTGLGYSYDERGVYIWNQTYGVDAGQRDPAVVLYPLENGMQLVLPRSRLPADVQQYLQQKQDDAIKALQEKMTREGFKPATQPSNPDL